MSLPRPQLFAGLGEEFAGAFGNVDCLFTIDGVAEAKPVRGILRQKIGRDLGDEFGQDVEGITQTLSVPATGLDHLESQRDSVEINGQTFEIANQADDGRAMKVLFLKGNV
ncbi:hypothetical protein [Martelella sp. HB161492]|uniref:head-tail joining protein n=1 Tax=Martelella sp. HB161492 TaxID=2720726 RepID=UPI0015927857|nr:hypothetical protein [Martelella sp. HB161492]